METLPTLSRKETLILTYLLKHSKAYGLEMVNASDGLLKRGTVYVTLNRMEDKGYIESKLQEREGKAPNRIYNLTGYGIQVLQAWQNYGAVLGLAV